MLIGYIKMCRKPKNFIKNPEQICIRKSDNTVWLPSFKDHTHSLLALLGEAPRFYFKHLHKFKNGFIIHHAHVWEHDDGSLFKISKRID